MYEMHGQLIIINATTPLPLFAIAVSGGGVVTLIMIDRPCISYMAINIEQLRSFKTTK